MDIWKGSKHAIETIKINKALISEPIEWNRSYRHAQRKLWYKFKQKLIT